MSVKLRQKILKDKRISLYLDMYVNGKRSYEFLNLYLSKDKDANKETLRLADTIRAKRELEIASNEHGFIPAHKRKIDFITYFEQKAKNDSWITALNHLKNFTKSIHISAIDKHWVKSFQEYLLSRVSQNSAQHYMVYINNALNQAVKEKLISENPCNYIDKIKTIEIEKSYLTLSDVEKLANTECKNPEVKRAFLFSCYTGLRISDVKNLTFAEIKDNKIQFRQQKTKSVEYLPLNKMAKSLIKDDTKILPMPHNKVFNLPNRNLIYKSLKQWCEDAGIEKHITFHTARHTFATIAISRGVDLYTVSKLLGHRDLSTTQIYAKIVNEKMQEAVNKLPALNIRGG